MPASVLFMCSTNSVRSPMAEALMKHFHGHRVFVASAGVRTREIDPFVVAVMAERGLDLARHRARTLEDLADTSFDLVITLTPESHHRALELTRTLSIEIEYWPTFDPTAIEGTRDARLDAYRAVRDHLEKRLLERFGREAGPRV
ncbi:MAG: arsenate reductase ArsC [Alphaproteobacteria bacterium]